ncbi:MAG: hypothetical protein SGBAC_011432 [Bacillariaceae sp.]
MPTFVDEKKSLTLLEEYEDAVWRPATKVFDLRKEDPTTHGNQARKLSILLEDSVAKKRGIEDAFVVPNLLTAQECQALLNSAENHGIFAPQKANGTPRTAKRTANYQDEGLSKTIHERLAPLLAEIFAKGNDEEWCGNFHGIHSNWRVVRYDPGDAFPAHQDQMDTIQRKDARTGKKDYLVSTHTLLIQLTPPTHDLRNGGATRFYPKAKLGADTTPGQYEESIDVYLPQGWALAFPQMGLVHAGQPIPKMNAENATVGNHSKYIAQAGILRNLPAGKLFRPSIFKLGPGIPRP